MTSSTSSPSLTDVFAGDGIFRIENWYPKLEPLTFKTVVFDLNYDEAQSLVKYRELQTLSLYKLQEEKKKTHSKASLVLDNETILKVKEEVMRSLTAKHKVALESLVSKLSSAIEPFASSAAKGAFVKTSSRSPKDAAFLTKAMKTILRERVLENIRKYPNATEQEAGDLDAIAFVQAATQSMRVTSAEQALELLLSSKRTRDDIAACVLQLGEEKFDMKMIVREWVDFDPVWEFRAFVFGGKLTACTQYWTRVHVKGMSEKAEEISACIEKYWETKVKPLVPIDVYTVDFVIDPNSFENIKLIELNPPPPAAGQALFDWNSTKDRKIISEGPYEFRVEARSKYDPLEGIHSPSRHLIHLLRGREVTERSPSNIRCDGCGVSPISKVEWHSCRLCGEYDVCAECFSQERGSDSTCTHVLIKQRQARTEETASSSSESADRDGCTKETNKTCRIM